MMFTSRILIGLITATAIVVLSLIGAAYFATPKSTDTTNNTWKEGVALPKGSFPPASSNPFTVVKSNSGQVSSTTKSFGQGADTVDISKSFEYSGSADDVQTYFDNLTNSQGAAKSSVYNQPVDYMHLYSFNLGPTTDTPTLAPTVTQQALHNYGNTAGALIAQAERFASENNAALASFFESPSDTTEAKVIEIADRFSILSQSLSAISSTPENIQPTALSLLDAYKRVGEKLVLLAGSRGDEALLAAINTYTDAVSNLGTEFGKMVDIFSAADVVFETNEPGSIFMFTL